MYKRKYEKGHKITSMEELSFWLWKEEWIYYRHKAMHPGWIESMTFRSLKIAIEKDYLFIANLVK